MAAMTDFDVVVAGGGIAGQCIARQLRRDLPQVSVAVIDTMARPLPEAAFKVGEATVEMGAHYLAERLGLREHLQQEHLLKMGLRYYLGGGGQPFAERPEMGLTSPPLFDSYIVDRGRLENHLREENALLGVDVIEGASVTQIDLGVDDAPHRVTYRSAGDDLDVTLSARWVVDATGRRRMLQRQLGLTDPGDAPCSSVWFRVDGRVDVADLVPVEETAWHERVPAGMRHRAIVHLLGDGYWVWLIALPNDKTSVGIVVDERIQRFDTLNTHERASAWMNAHEPELARHLESFPVLDFRVMRHYSYSSHQVFSIDRWSCVGEASVFADPFYAPGIDMVGVSNTITVEMIRQDLEGRLTPEDVETWSRWFISVNQALGHNIQVGYPFFDQTTVAAAKLVWDFAAAWGYEAPQILNRTYLDRAAAAPIREATSRFIFLQVRMHRLLADWAKRPRGSCSFKFMDYLTFEYLVNLRDRNLRAGKSIPELAEDARQNMEILEEVAQAIFLVAVADQFPEHAHRFAGPVWLNAWAIGMDPSRWDEDGLFAPTTEARDLTRTRADLARGLGVPEPVPSR